MSPVVVIAAIVLIARSMSPAPAAPMPVAARRATVSAVIRAASEPLLSVIAPAEVVTWTSPLVFTFDRAMLLTASMSIRPVPLLVTVEVSARVTAPAESMPISKVLLLEMIARAFRLKLPPVFCSSRFPPVAVTFSVTVMVSVDVITEAPPTDTPVSPPAAPICRVPASSAYRLPSTSASRLVTARLSSDPEPPALPVASSVNNAAVTRLVPVIEPLVASRATSPEVVTAASKVMLPALMSTSPEVTLVAFVWKVTASSVPALTVKLASNRLSTPSICTLSAPVPSVVLMITLLVALRKVTDSPNRSESICD
ncbi:hypothetical protein Enr10x_14170 [Gimesia panareensis]|uniref:Secreted protein n=1 Tax=Gimesia panareensis TaxID=2527978 RepID=A0A517Q3A6_9PLAN|nr:hypothetical protein Enr10x_14170 [Gimesia panareensis]